MLKRRNLVTRLVQTGLPEPANANRTFKTNETHVFNVPRTPPKSCVHLLYIYIYVHQAHAHTPHMHIYYIYIHIYKYNTMGGPLCVHHMLRHTWNAVRMGMHVQGFQLMDAYNNPFSGQCWLSCEKALSKHSSVLAFGSSIGSNCSKYC